ncbi:MAG: hypothetical protein EPN47_20700 [Acidobacteria bacterium]|nr:MAG: hypothetical protein EPN47_20700 [Acidobacteriota bacterium]
MSPTIRVEQCGPGRFQVTVTEGASKSTHRVSLSPDYYEKLTQKQVSQEVLIERSFQFLLKHEPKESILREFDLPLIGRYFPDYEGKIRVRLAS